MIRCSRAVVWISAIIWLALSPQAAAGQDGVVQGVVRNADGPLPGVQVYLVDRGIGSVTDSSGAYSIATPPGLFRVQARYLGFESTTKEALVARGDTVQIDFLLKATTIHLDDLVVIATGESQSRTDVAASIGTISGSVIDQLKPGHPAEIMQRVPGVWVTNTTGEGHMTAIRQPLSTEPVYLYLEDGIPTRSTGFFNHNALNEINIPQANSVEVLRGPGTALYGSDAIGGVINVTTKRAPDRPSLGVSLEGGSYGFGRILVGAGASSGNSGLNINLNVTRSDGWRVSTDYDRQSGTLRWDQRLDQNRSFKTLLSISNVDQKPAGSSGLSEEDFEQDPRQNYTPISFRKVQAYRLSTEYEQVMKNSILTITPHVRYNTMSLLPNWSLGFDPATWETSNYSVGMMAKHRTNFTKFRARLIAGLDLDLSPGERVETKADPTRQDGVFVAYTTQERLYDYDVTFRQVAPFVHGEISPLPDVRLTAGFRVDALGYDYRNNLSVVTSGRHRRAASTARSFTHVSPKLGVTYQILPSLNGFAAFNHAFRVPSESQLFRQGSTSNTLDLDPVKVNSYELGLRTKPVDWLQADVSLYLMNKEDDIVTFTDDAGIRLSTNAGATSHKGIELGVGFEPGTQFRLDGALTVAKHTYEDWQPDPTTDLSGNEMAVAPREIGNLAITIQPDMLKGSLISAEWTHLGGYWTDPENTTTYNGHDLLSIKASAPVSDKVSVFARLMNVTNELYAERATFNAFRGDEFAPGLPRTFFVGVRFDVEKQ